MSIKTAANVGSISLWWHLGVIIVCYALVFSSLGNETAKPDVKSWDGLSYDDPQRDIKIFSYVFSIYLGIEMCDIRPRNGFAYIVRNIILACRMLFILHVAKNVFYMIAENIERPIDVNVGDAVDEYIQKQLNKAQNRPIEPKIASREEEWKHIGKILGGKKLKK
tara:strand:+ start:2480 stop:2974 length:495 start_codon:yes stop_codon:yes gene_type:complete